MTENKERAEQARSVFHIEGCQVQIVTSAGSAVQVVHQGDGTVARTEQLLTPAAPLRKEAEGPPCEDAERVPCEEEVPTLAAYIPDEALRLLYERRLRSCPSMVIVCQTVLPDLFNDVLADYSAPRKLVKSRAFISALLPHLTFESGATVENMRSGIRKYVLGE